MIHQFTEKRTSEITQNNQSQTKNNQSQTKVLSMIHWQSLASILEEGMCS